MDKHDGDVNITLDKVMYTFIINLPGSMSYKEFKQYLTDVIGLDLYKHRFDTTIRIGEKRTDLNYFDSSSWTVDTPVNLLELQKEKQEGYRNED